MGSSNDHPIPPEVRKFILRYLESVEQVRILQLLRRDPSRQWSTEELVAELRSTPIAIEKRMRELYGRKVLRKGPASDRHSYLPYDDEVGKGIEMVFIFNETYPYRIIELIYSRRDEAMKDFAEAFKIKKDK